MLKRALDTIARDDEGVALITVIGVVLVMSILAIMSYNLASNALVATRVNESESDAFQVANAGIDTVYAALAMNDSTVVDYYSAGTTLTVGDGICEIALEEISGIEYSCTATGYAGDGTTETVKVRFYYLNLWEMFVASGGEDESLGGGAINGNASVVGPFYVHGNINDMTGNASFEKGPLFVTGDISTNGSATIGTEDVPIDLYVGGSYPTNANRIFVRRVSNSVPDIAAPVLDQGFIDTAFAQSCVESVDNLQGTNSPSEGFVASANNEAADGTPGAYSDYPDGTSGRAAAAGASSWYKCITSGTSAAAIGEGTSLLVIDDNTASFGSWAGDGWGYTGDATDDFAYDAATRTLYVEGTIFIDGDFVIETDILYVGNGAIVVNGDVTIDGDVTPNTPTATADRPAYSMDSDHVLGIICAGTMGVAGDGNNVKGGFDVVAALYARDLLEFTSGSPFMRGSIVAPRIDFSQANTHLESDPELPEFLPKSMPGRDTPILVIGAWSRQ